jgi:DNA-binding MarR family transcriptional regulator
VRRIHSLSFSEFSNLASDQNRPFVYRRLAERAGVELGPQEIWLLARIEDHPGALQATLEKRLKLSTGTLQQPLAALVRSRLVSQTKKGELQLTPKGHAVREKLKKTWEVAVAELCDEWAPGSHPEIRRMLDTLIRALRADMPRCQTGHDA